MFNQPPSLTMRAAMASLLGSLFGIAMILYTHSAHAQGVEAPAPAASSIDPVAVIKRLGNATLLSLRGSDAAPGGGGAAMRGLRIADSNAEAVAGLRWQAAPRRVLRSEVENPRGADPFALGLQVRF